MNELIGELPSIGLGDRGHWVRIVQHATNLALEAGQRPLIIDGEWGPRTDAAARLVGLVKGDGRMTEALWRVAGIYLRSGGEQKGTRTPLASIALEVAISQVGIREIGGANRGTAVETYLGSIGLPKGHPWCMGFVNWCIQVAGLMRGERPDWPVSGHVLTVLSLGRNRGLARPLADTRAGDVFCMRIGTTGAGHTGFIVTPGVTNLTVEGNTNDAGSREGDGVYRKARHRRTFAGILAVRRMEPR